MPIFLLAVLACLAGPSRADQWAFPTLRYRVPLVVKDYTPSQLPGDDLAEATFRTGRAARADLGDLRLADEDGRELPWQLIRSGPGDEVTIVFPLRAGFKRAYAYFGNPRVQREAHEPLDIRRGLLLEVWPFAGGKFKTLDQARRALARAKSTEPFGRGFAPRVFLGYNPFAEDERIVSLWTGYFPVEKGGEYRFCSSSRNASFVVVDGKEVFANGGWHGEWGRVHRFGKVTLGPGLHKLEVLHVSPRHQPRISLVWTTPQDPIKWEVMPRGAFAPLIRAHTGPRQEKGQRIHTDFRVLPGGEIFLADHYIQRREFLAFWWGPKPPEPMRLEWDFGDGQSRTTSEPRVEHVYLADGTYTVTLRLHAGQQCRTIAHEVVIERNWLAQARRKLDDTTHYATLAARQDFDTLPPVGRARAVLLLDRVGDHNALRRAGAALLRAGRVDGDLLVEVMPLLAESLALAASHDQAVTSYTRAIACCEGNRARAALGIQAGRFALRHGQVDQAETFYSGVLNRPEHSLPEKLRRAALLGTGDVARARGLASAARDAYGRAGPGNDRAAKNAPLFRGDMARQVEAYLNTGQLAAAGETLDEWENALPTDRMEGYSTLLRVEWLLAGKRRAEAAWQAEMLLAANPKSPYAPRLLMRSAEAYVKLRQADRAIEALKRILREYPESPESIEAGAWLDKAAGN